MTDLQARVAINEGEAPLVLRAEGVVRYYNKHEVLKGVTLSLPQGKILGLLGPSGCGKTTFLKCVVGRLFVHGGRLEVLGKEPCSAGHQVPGKLVGYMPQEIALFNEFTVSETLQYCSKLHGMSHEDFKSRKHTLLNLLDMPALEYRLVSGLSGGQKRRLSLAVALIHAPPLLMLDEPTVGVDPLLRAKLWEHLVMLARDTGVSIVVTTHYIEEARAADIVCFMREGRILVEDSPQALIEKHRQTTLEEVFLEMCRHQATHSHSGNQLGGSGTTAASAVSWDDAEEENGNGESVPLLSSAAAEGSAKATANGGKAGSKADNKVPTKARRWRFEAPRPPRARNVATILWKNVTRLRRSLMLLVFSFMTPALQIILYFLAIGRDPHGLHMAVVNSDVGFSGQRFSDQFLSLLDSNTITLDNYNTYDEALSRVHAGKAWGIYQFNKNFTFDLFQRFIRDIPIDQKAAYAEDGQIRLSLDFSNQQIAIAIEQCTSDALEALATSMLGGYSALASPPLRILPPLYGPDHPTFTDFVAPGIMVTIGFAQAMALTALAFVIDRKEGLLDRTWAMGVVPAEVILGHAGTQVIIIGGQITLMLIFALLVFGLPLCGNLGLVVFLMFLLGLAGMLYGLTVSTVSPEESHAIQIAMGSFFPLLLLSGVIWPLEAIPTGLNYISWVLPTTWAGDAMRSVMLRGWGLEHPSVWQAVLVILGWVLLFLVLSVLGVKRTE